MNSELARNWKIGKLIRLKAFYIGTNYKSKYILKILPFIQRNNMRSGREAEIAISTVPKVLAFIFAVRGATTNLLANICLYRCAGYNS